MTSTEAIARAGALWAQRAAAELDAAARFRRITELFVLANAKPVVIDMARAAEQDELRHHARCVALARRFGRTVAEVSTGRAAPLGAGARTIAEQALFEAIAMACVTETLSTALLMEIRAAAVDDEVADTVDEILRDEVDHARLGWAHLAAEAPRRDLTFVAPRLPAMLAMTVDEEVFGPDDGGPLADAVAGLGGLPRARRRDVFVTTMRDVVFPGLRTHGIDVGAAEAWLAERRR